MTFSKDSVKKIVSGRKTATTRVSGRYRVGRIYVINPYPAKNPKARFDEAVGYIRITEEPKEIQISLQRIVVARSRLVAHAGRYYYEEGFNNPEECYDRFLELKLDEKLKKYRRLYFYRFEYLGKTDPRKARGKEK